MTASRIVLQMECRLLKAVAFSLIASISYAQTKSPTADLQFLGKSEHGNFYTKYSETCCLSGRSENSAELVAYSAKNPSVRVSKQLREFDIDGEQNDIKYQSLYYQNKIFFVTISNWLNEITYEGSFWKWDPNENKLVELLPGKNDITLKIKPEKSPSKIYAPLDELIETGKIEEAWVEASSLRATAYPDAFRTTNINYEANSGHALHMAFFSKLRETALQSLKSGEKKETGLRVCRALKFPDPVSYLDGSEPSDPCDIAKLKIEVPLEPDEEGFEDIAIKAQTFSIPKACLIQANDFNIARTNEAVTTMNDLGFILDEAGFHKEAVSILKAVIKSSPNRAVAYLNLADAYGHLGETKKADAEYKRYLAKLGAKNQAQAAPRTEWVQNPSSEECPSIAKVQKLVLSKKPQKQVQKALDDFYNSGGNMNSFVIDEREDASRRYTSLVHFLASQGHYQLMEESLRSDKTVLGLEEALRESIYDHKQEAKTIKLLEKHGAKYLSSEIIGLYFSSEPAFLKAKDLLMKYRNSILEKHFDTIVSSYARWFDMSKALKRSPSDSKIWLQYLKGSSISKSRATRFLFEAIKQDDLALAQVLLHLDADVNGFNDDGQTPLELAKSNALKAFLKDHGAKTADQLGEIILISDSNQRRAFESLPPKIRERVAAELKLPFH